MEISNKIGKQLKEIRESLGFDSARSFYQDHLSKKSKLEFNYSYYMKIEGGRALPSHSVITGISELLPVEHQRLLIRAYCQSLFPKHSDIFTNTQTFLNKKNIKQSKTISENLTLTKQRYLTELQIACLARSKYHYFLFLILTLSRQPILISDLKASLGLLDVNKVLADLKDAKLAHQEDQYAECSTKEMKFPKAETESLKKLYVLIDDWNLSFPEHAKFESLENKMMIRRISSRYLSLLLSQSQFMFDFMKAADEVQQDCNNEVVMLNFSLSRGSLPG